MSAIAQQVPSILILAGPFYIGATLLVGLVLAALRYQRIPRRRTAVVIVALTLGLAAVSGLSLYRAYQSYVAENTWTFSYQLGVQGNGTGPEFLIVPIATNESLLAGLHLSSGTANWSFVDTPKGRGLFVRFTGSTILETTVSTLPRPSVLPDTSPTMTVPTNCTEQPANCTGRPTVWIFYSGPSWASLGLYVGSSYLWQDLAIGWATYQTWPPPAPVA